MVDPDMKRSYVIAGAAAVAVVAFLLFRPDKLFADDPVSESLEEAFTTTSSTSTAAASSTAPAETSATTAAPIETTTTAGLVVTSSGSFQGIDHRAGGTATVYEQDGQYVLRFEDDTDIQNGPDLYVWLLSDDTYQARAPTDYLDLGKLKGNIGAQNYPLPADFDPEVHRLVLVWCLRFAVPFAAAPLG